MYKVKMKLVCIKDDNSITLGCKVGDVVQIQTVVKVEEGEKDIGYVFVRTPNSPDIPRAVFLADGYYTIRKDFDYSDFDGFDEEYEEVYGD